MVIHFYGHLQGAMVLKGQKKELLLLLNQHLRSSVKGHTIKGYGN
jgi:hypothetical protein